jgi:hypothetical protein
VSLYLDVSSLKGYLRIGSTDAIDDALLGEICDAVELEQIARCRPETFGLVELTVSPSSTDPNGVTATTVGYGIGPFSWVWGDGNTDNTGYGVTGAGHVYATPGPYTLELHDSSATVLGSVALTVPLGAPTSSQGSTVNVPADVYHAALMRGARLYWRRASPEGLVGLGELGAVRVPPFDRDIDALEAPWRCVVLA